MEVLQLDAGRLLCWVPFRYASITISSWQGLRIVRSHLARTVGKVGDVMLPVSLDGCAWITLVLYRRRAFGKTSRWQGARARVR